MADLVITAANVVPGATAKTRAGTAGAAVTPGQPLYEAADGKWYPADCDSATAAARSPLGLALNTAAAGQPVDVVRGGPVILGAVLTAGVGYYLSATAGGICPVADLASGDYPVFLGFAISASVLDVTIVEAGVALA